MITARDGQSNYVSMHNNNLFIIMLQIGDDVAPRSLPLLTDTSIRDIDKGRVCTIGRSKLTECGSSCVITLQCMSSINT